MDPHFEGVIYQTHAAELVKRLGYDFPAYMALDVRDASAWAAGHIPSAHNVTPGQLASGLPDGTSETTEFFVIGSGPNDTTVREASLALRRNGALRVVEFSGGMSEWTAYGYTTESEAAA